MNTRWGIFLSVSWIVGLCVGCSPWSRPTADHETESPHDVATIPEHESDSEVEETNSSEPTDSHCAVETSSESTGTHSDVTSQGSDDATSSQSSAEETDSHDTGHDTASQSDDLPCFARWTRLSPRGWEMPSVNDAWSAGQGDVIAVGSAGRLLRYDGHVWSNLASPTSEWLGSVHGRSPDDWWAAGGLDSLLHFDGTAVSEVSFADDGPYHRVFAAADGAIWAIKLNGMLARMSGGQVAEFDWGDDLGNQGSLDDFVESPSLGLWVYGRQAIHGEAALEHMYAPLLLGLADGLVTAHPTSLIGSLTDAAVLPDGDILFLLRDIVIDASVFVAPRHASVIRFDAESFETELELEAAPWPVSLAVDGEDVLMLGESGEIWRRTEGAWGQEEAAPAQVANRMVVPESGAEVVFDRSSGVLQRTEAGWSREGGSCAGQWLYFPAFADGAWHFASYKDVVRVVDDECQFGAVESANEAISDLLVDADGHLIRGLGWYESRVEVLEDGKWRDLALPSGSSVFAFDVDSEGRVYAVLNGMESRLARLEGGHWQELAGLPASLLTLFGVEGRLASDGVAYVLHPAGQTVFAYREGAWHALEVPSGETALELREDAAGEVYLRTYEGGLYALSPEEMEEVARLEIEGYVIDPWLPGLWIFGPQDIYVLAGLEGSYDTRDLLHFTAQGWSMESTLDGRPYELVGGDQGGLIALGYDVGYVLEDGQWHPFELMESDEVGISWDGPAVWVEGHELMLGFSDRTLRRYDFGLEQWSIERSAEASMDERWNLIQGASDAAVWSSSHGEVHLRTGEGWQVAAQAAACVGSLSALWSGGPKDLYAACYGAGVLRFDGDGWEPLATGLTHDVRDVWGTGPGDVWVGAERRGAGPVLAHYDGHTWSTVEGPVSEVADLWGTSIDDMYALGGPDEDRVYHYDGEAWTEAYVLPGEAVQVGGRGPDDVYVVSDDGDAFFLSHFDGAAWQSAELPLGQHPYGFMFDADGRGRMVGAGGLILEQTCDPRAN